MLSMHPQPTLTTQIAPTPASVSRTYAQHTMHRNIRREILAPGDQSQENNNHLQDIPGTPITPIRSQKTPTKHCLITPPNSIGRSTHVTSAIEPQAHTLPSSLLLPPPTAGVFPTPPTTISELTLPLLTSLSRCLTYSPCFHPQTLDHFITIPCVTPDLLYTWIQPHKHRLYSKEFHCLWEYSPSAETFIIKCMPTPIHKNLAYYASSAIHDELRVCTGVGMLHTPVKVLLNTEIATTGRSGGRGRRIPDFCIKVRIHPQSPQKYFTGVVWEVGFSQSLASLKRRARMWLGGSGGTGGNAGEVGDKLGLKVHSVILVHISEGEGPAVYYNDDGQKVMTRGKARETKWDWPSRWFGGRGVVEEVEWRGGVGQAAITGKGAEELREELIQEIKEGLVAEDGDGNGKLIPLLMEPLGATLIVYGRNEVIEVPNTAGGLHSKDEQVSDNDDENKGQDASDDSGADSGSGSSSQSVEEVNQLFTPGDRPKSTDTSADTDSNLYSDNTTSDNLTDGNTTDDDTADATAGIQQVYTRPLLHNNLPLHDHPTPPFELTVAELYAPLPRNSTSIPEHILDTMPPLMRPHAYQKIRFPLEELVDSILVDLEQMRERRARDRAEGIVKKAWGEVEAEVERVRREQARAREAQERELRLVGRRRARSRREEVGVEQAVVVEVTGKKRARREG
ncbi:hypothetical protein L211DRAFT_580551 [Terfezia boudieri ATCC MYA-4762]|uniref:Uncharacterized protein n=1 Tax=Terfezia boudieri ATCC MYA-4762 TaxID=1051890 RepID=A0A3N4LGX5_9PEZI|nr:hypothetical protein L211DRAFT_580551 [Terfezia boudieri ATCC MYA-4762]